MAKLNNLNTASAFNPGSELWVIPELDASSVSRKIDWYLNFQIYQFLNHKKSELSDRVKEILQACELKKFDFVETKKSKKLGILISSSTLLPNRWTYYIEGSHALSGWLEQIQMVWTGLGKPSLRIVAPSNYTYSEFKEKIDAKEFEDPISVVIDKGS
jgi:hypothetical protein